MIRINLIDPVKLSDQHLIAEYNEILMLLGYVRKYHKVENIPENYKLGTGHIKFFKKKLGAKIIIEKNKGHFTEDDGVKKDNLILDEIISVMKLHR